MCIYIFISFLFKFVFGIFFIYLYCLFMGFLFLFTFCTLFLFFYSLFCKFNHFLKIFVFIEIAIFGIFNFFLIESLLFGEVIGFVFGLFVLGLAAAETCLGLSLVVLYYYLFRTIKLDVE
jgi:NADH:ubiquinone oxidoreductase subunit K